MKTFSIWILTCMLAFSTLRAQIEPDSFFVYSRAGLVDVYQRPPNSPIQLAMTLSLPVPQFSGSIKLIGVDPRTLELWALVEDGGRGQNRAQRFIIQGNQLLEAESILIPSPCFFQGSMPGAGFDDQGIFIAMVGMACIVRMDLEQRVLLSTNTSCSCNYPWVFEFVPAKAGRPALLQAINNQGEHSVVTLDSNFQTQDVLFRTYQPSAIYLPVFKDIVTTESGRSFLGGNQIPLGGMPMTWRGLHEIDYANRQVVRRATELGVHDATLLIADALPGQLSFVSWNDDFGWPTTQSRNYYDLATDRVVRQVVETLASDSPIHAAESAPWFPRGKVLASPLHPPIGTAQDFALHIGGGPGDLALLWCDRAELGGVPLSGLNSPIALGVIDPMGVLPVRVPYDPSLVPLRAGDAVWFQGFTWNGFDLVATREVEIRWR